MKRVDSDKVRLASAVEALKCQLKCLVICISHSWGGLEQVVAEDSIALANLGLSPRVLCLLDSPIHKHLLASKASVEIVPIEFTPRNYFDLKLKAKLNELMSIQVNLVHTHQTSLLGSIVPELWNHRSVALLASRHMMNGHNKKGLYHRAIYSRVDSLIVMSQALKENVIQTHAMPERRVKVIHLGLDFEKFNPQRVFGEKFRAQWGANENTIVIGLVGRIDPAKGQSTFIRGAATLLKNLEESKRNIRFVIVGEETLGSESHYLQELKEMVRQFQLEDYVVFAGYQDNIPAVMQSFDVAVMPSRQETFGLVAIEAMAMECPIVISSGGSAFEIVGNSEYGLVVRPDDPFDLQRQLKYLLDHPEERREMGRKAREHVRSQYDRHERLIKTLALYEKVLRKRRAL